NVDMIGDKNLDIKRESASNKGLTELVWKTAAEFGYRANFLDEELRTDDDHMPFVKLGAPAIDLIDFDYDPWHEDTDTIDKLSGKSFEIVGRVVKEVIR